VGSTDETTTLLLSTGESLEVKGPLDEVAKLLENAARSSAGTLAWLHDAQAGERLGVNPAQVVSVHRRPGGRSPGTL
jgi:hypothetical protein